MLKKGDKDPVEDVQNSLKHWFENYMKDPSAIKPAPAPDAPKDEAPKDEAKKPAEKPAEKPGDKPAREEQKDKKKAEEAKKEDGKKKMADKIGVRSSWLIVDLYDSAWSSL